jgi:hypothetical protein
MQIATTALSRANPVRIHSVQLKLVCHVLFLKLPVFCIVILLQNAAVGLIVDFITCDAIWLMRMTSNIDYSIVWLELWTEVVLPISLCSVCRKEKATGN